MPGPLGGGTGGFFALGEIFSKIAKPMNKIGEIMANSSKVIWKNIKSMKKEEKEGKKRRKGLNMLGGIFLNILGVFLQLADAMGVMQPILQLITAMFQIMGGAAMEALAPALEYIGEKFKDPVFIETLQEIGKAIGELLAAGLTSFLDILPIILKALLPLIKLLGSEGMIGVITILAKIIGFLIIGALVPLVTVIYMVGLVIAGIMDLFTLGANKYVENWTKDYITFMHGVGTGVGEIFALQSGGYVAPQTGGTPVILAEGGEGEFVIPESKMGSIGGNKEVLWATEDNGSRLDRIAYLLESKGRLI